MRNKKVVDNSVGLPCKFPKSINKVILPFMKVSQPSYLFFQ